MSKSISGEEKLKEALHGVSQESGVIGKVLD
jgi:hypothetical protein